jgi:hypothetical protein
MALNIVEFFFVGHGDDGKGAIVAEPLFLSKSEIVRPGVRMRGKESWNGESEWLVHESLADSLLPLLGMGMIWFQENFGQIQSPLDSV